ncbi:HD domain-containing protein [Candidatus Fermentibacteria bacterium]|nr:HD domain-containing protein [Candidatus Fermentibacteria bacterium]
MKRPVPLYVRILRIAAIGILYGFLNKAGILFAGSLGVSLVYPASALGVVAAQFWRVETGCAVFMATVLTPWHAANPFWLMMVYGVGNVIEALLPTRLLRPVAPGKEIMTAVRVVWGTIVVNTLLNAALGVSGQVLTGRWQSLSDASQALWSWWVSDAIAIAILAFPVLGLFKQGLFLAGHERIPPRRAFPWPGTAVVVVSIIGVATFGGWIAARSLITSNWTMLLLLFPLGWITVKRGLPGGAWAYGVTGCVYLATVGFHARDYRLHERPDEVLALYGNLLAYFSFVLFGGVISSRNMELVRRLHARFQNLRSSFDAAVLALGAAIEAKDPYTEGHVERVADSVEQIARVMGVEGEDLDLVRYAALLHDVGKIAVPESILTKPGPLTVKEREIMERHVETGPAILERIGLLEEAAPLIRYHEERYDGKTDGPYAGEFGLRGSEIPLGARIIAVADAYDAMTSDRPYRKAFTQEKALAELQRNAGSQFDPEVVRAFFRVLEVSPASLSAGTRSGRRSRRRH